MGNRSLLKRKCYRLPRLHALPYIAPLWRDLLRVFGNEINGCDSNHYGSGEVYLEALIVDQAYLAYFHWGNVYEIDPSDDTIDYTVSEDILNELGLCDLYIDDNSINGDTSYWLGYSISEIVFKLRCTFYRMWGTLKFNLTTSDNFTTYRVTNTETTIEADGMWSIVARFVGHDSGLPLYPTLREFKRLMFSWQELYGHMVGKESNYEGDDGFYIGRNRERYDARHAIATNGAIMNTEVPMGNRFSSKSRKSINVITATGETQVIDLRTKLEACYAFYLDLLRRLTIHGCNEGDDHWIHIDDLLEKDLVCHCGDWTNERNEEHFCHGLVLHAMTVALSGVD